MGRPKGSRNQPKLIEHAPRIERGMLSIPRECLKIIHDRARGSGLSPQMVLEDLILAGDFNMGPIYDDFTNYRSRLREKAANRTKFVPVRIESAREVVDSGETGSDELETTTPVQNGSYDAPVQRRHRPEDNPAFRDPGSVGDVIGVASEGSGYQTGFDEFPDQGPVETDEEGNPLEPQEVQEYDQSGEPGNE